MNFKLRHRQSFTFVLLTSTALFGCGGEGTTTGGGDTSGEVIGIVPCAGDAPLMVLGEDSGYAKCDGDWLHRPGLHQGRRLWLRRAVRLARHRKSVQRCRLRLPDRRRRMLEPFRLRLERGHPGLHPGRWHEGVRSPQ